MKREYLAGKWNALFAADDLSHAEALLEEAKVELSKVDVGKFAQVLSALRIAREAVLVRLAGDASLPPGLSLGDFYQEGRKILSDLAYQDVWSRLAKFKLACDLLIFGFDDAGSAHIAVVGDEAPTSYDRIGFHAIGSGWVNAIGILSAHDLSPVDSWRETAYAVLAAKKAGERAVGVGALTLLWKATDADQRIQVDHEKLGDLVDQYGLIPAAKAKADLKKELAKVVLVKKSGGA